MNAIQGWKGWMAAVLLSVSTLAMADGHDAKTLSPESGSSVNALSAWTNQSGSTLYIDTISPGGQITGTYINRASGYRCRNSPYPVTGWIHGATITFTVKWQNQSESCNSLTAWTGFIENMDKITTLWQLVRNGTTNTGQILKGTDVFTLDTPVMHKSLHDESQ